MSVDRALRVVLVICVIVVLGTVSYLRWQNYQLRTNAGTAPDSQSLWSSPRTGAGLGFSGSILSLEIIPTTDGVARSEQHKVWVVSDASDQKTIGLNLGDSAWPLTIVYPSNPTQAGSLASTEIEAAELFSQLVPGQKIAVHLKADTLPEVLEALGDPSRSQIEYLSPIFIESIELL